MQSSSPAVRTVSGRSVEQSELLMSNTILVTGATGKVGQVFIRRLLVDSKFDSFIVRALCHQRELEVHPRIENIHGSIEHRDVVEKAMDGVTHILHLATCKENPD